MPRLDGPGFYRELERLSPEHAHRVMFMTGETIAPETAELLSATRTPLLRKPFKVEEIRGTVQRFFLDLERLAQKRCRSEEHTSELQSLAYLVCRLLLEK